MNKEINLKNFTVSYTDIEERTNARLQQLEQESNAIKILCSGKTPDERKPAINMLGCLSEISGDTLAELPFIRDKLREEGDDKTADDLEHLHGKHCKYSSTK